MKKSIELYKIAGAVLPALLLIVAVKLIIDARTASREAQFAQEKGFKLPEPAAPGKEAAPGAAAPEKAAFDAAAVVAKVATASAENGAGVFKQCQACHVADSAAKSTVGPNLWGIVGRARGSRADYEAKYSKVLKEKAGDWSYNDLAAFAHNPAEFLPGTGMKFKGIKDGGDVADLLAYLRTLADSPAPLPN